MESWRRSSSFSAERRTRRVYLMPVSWYGHANTRGMAGRVHSAASRTRLNPEDPRETPCPTQNGVPPLFVPSSAMPETRSRKPPPSRERYCPSLSCSRSSLPLSRSNQNGGIIARGSQGHLLGLLIQLSKVALAHDCAAHKRRDYTMPLL